MMAFKCNQYNTLERPQDVGPFSIIDNLLVLLLFWTSDDL